MKKTFLTGIIFLLPSILTIIILGFLVNFLTNPFVNAIEWTLNLNRNSNDPIFSLYNSTTLLLLIRFIILTAIFFFVILIGYVTQSFFTYSLFRYIDDLIKRIPVIRSIYKAIQDVIRTLFSQNSNSFKQVVLVPYPNKDSLSIGFITSTNEMSDEEDSLLKDKIPVFVAGAPNPTVGFILIYPKEDVILIDMKVDEAFKLLISCGIMMPILPKP